MKANKTKKIAVIGLGTMGPGIILSFAQVGYQVQGFDTAPDAQKHCLDVLHSILTTLQEFSHISDAEATAALKMVSFASSLEEVVAHADIIIEAVSENCDVKRSIYEIIDRNAPAECLIWSNTSTLNIFELMPERRQAKTVIAHWFSPPHIIPLVEVVKGPKTSEKTVATTLTVLKQQKKIPIVIEKYLPGFIINRILRNLGREAFFLLDNGYISAQELDLAVKASIAPRMMVLGLIQRYDFTGLDLSARNLLDENFFDPPINNRPAALYERIDQDELGVKSGKGFYDYSDRSLTEICEQRDRQLLKVMQKLEFCLGTERLV